MPQAPDFFAAADAPPVTFLDFMLAGCAALAEHRDRAEAPVIHLRRAGNDSGPMDPAPAAPRQPLPKPAPAEAPLKEAA